MKTKNIIIITIVVLIIFYFYKKRNKVQNLPEDKPEPIQTGGTGGTGGTTNTRPTPAPQPLPVKPPQPDLTAERIDNYVVSPTTNPNTVPTQSVQPSVGVGVGGNEKNEEYTIKGKPIPIESITTEVDPSRIKSITRR